MRPRSQGRPCSPPAATTGFIHHVANRLALHEVVKGQGDATAHVAAERVPLPAGALACRRGTAAAPGSLMQAILPPASPAEARAWHSQNPQRGRDAGNADEADC